MRKLYEASPFGCWFLIPSFFFFARARDALAELTVQGSLRVSLGILLFCIMDFSASG